MAASIRIKNLDFSSAKHKLGTLQPPHGLRTQKAVEFGGLVLSNRSKKQIIACRSSAAEADSNVEDNSKETRATDGLSQRVPKASEIKSLLTELCDTTSIVEFELKLRGFRLKVLRNLAEQSAPQIPPVPAVRTVAEPASSTSLALYKPVSSSTGVSQLLERAADEGLLIINSPTVGQFWTSRKIKGARLRPACKEKDMIKEGKVVCYIEQLSSQIPVESKIAGEVVKILVRNGDPVGYGDPLIAILPSFPGIKKLL